MNIFADYAKFYDLLYGEKDYKIECDFLEKIFACYAHSQIQTILDLGCGTGGHAFPLAQKGYHVTGVDCSKEMLETAAAKSSFLEESQKPTFLLRDVRELNLGKKFDAVIAMFSVISYMITNEDLIAAFHAARRHLQAGGLFFFDAWFGPAVLSERPSNRCKIIESDNERIIRFVHSELNVLNHRVSVHYRLLRLCGDRIMDEVYEVHPMRFLFSQEVIYYLNQAGFQVRKLCPFLRLDDVLSERDWNMAVIATAQ